MTKKTEKKTEKTEDYINKRHISFRLAEAEIEYLDGLSELVEKGTGIVVTRTWVLSRCILLGGKIIEDEYGKRKKSA